MYLFIPLLFVFCCICVFTFVFYCMSQHARPSGVLRRRSDGLECAAWRPPRPVAQCRQFQEDAKDASVSECTWTLSALEALRNALYKFKTYLLTLLLLDNGVRLSFNKRLMYAHVLAPPPVQPAGRYSFAWRHAACFRSFCGSVVCPCVPKALYAIPGDEFAYCASLCRFVCLYILRSGGCYVFTSVRLVLINVVGK